MCLWAAAIIVTCAGLVSAAALVPAPPAVLPLVVMVCIGGPMVAAWELRSSIRTLRFGHWSASVRRQIERLPETKHPLGL
jgi:hypothetical protein